MKLILVLTTVCVIAGLLMGATYSLTVEKIRLQELNKEKEALRYVLPEAAGFSEKITGKKMDYYKGLDSEGELTGYAFISEGKGYSSIIKIMIGIDIEGTIKGIKILSQQETPGLGARLDEIASSGTIWDIFKGKRMEKLKGPWFQEQFRQKQPNDVETITGATITSKAVIDAVKATVDKFKMYES